MNQDLINQYFARNKHTPLELRNSNQHDWTVYDWQESLTEKDSELLSKNAVFIKEVATGKLDEIEFWPIAARFHFISLCLVEASDIFRSVYKYYSWLKYIDPNCDLLLVNELHTNGGKWLRNYAYSLFGGKCAYCGIPLRKGWHLDHVFPRSKGGTLTIENVLASCPYCNNSKGTKSLEDFLNWRTNQQYRKIKAKLHIEHLEQLGIN